MTLIPVFKAAGGFIFITFGVKYCEIRAIPSKTDMPNKNHGLETTALPVRADDGRQMILQYLFA